MDAEARPRSWPLHGLDVRAGTDREAGGGQAPLLWREPEQTGADSHLIEVPRPEVVDPQRLYFHRYIR